jgi:DnaJ-class molecular chaperone
VNEFKLPDEINSNSGADEIEGEYTCKKCKGWGFVNEENYEHPTGLTTIPVVLCPECEGSGIIDWIKRTRL